MSKKTIGSVITVISILLMSMFLGATSCSSGQAGKSQEEIKFDGTWTVIMMDGKELDPDDFMKGLPVIIFDTGKGEISGNSGCNSFFGGAEYKSDSVTVGEVASTMMACPNMELEDQFFKIINNQTLTGSTDGGKLTLVNDSGGNLVLTGEK